MYYAVFYSKDGTIHLWPNETKDGCEEKLLEILKDERVYDSVIELPSLNENSMVNTYLAHQNHLISRKNLTVWLGKDSYDHQGIFRIKRI